MNIPVEFHEYRAAHLLPYWISHAEEYLLFYGQPVIQKK